MTERLTPYDRNPAGYDDIDFDEVIQSGRVLDTSDVLALKALRTLNDERFDVIFAAQSRRCDGCAHWAVTYDPTQGDCARVDFQTSADWFCADFKAKP
jgi:hypothetical protein